MAKTNNAHTVISGIGGAVNGIPSVRTWSISINTELPKWVASNTLRGPGRAVGNKDWTGSISCYGHTPTVKPGDVFTFLGTQGSDLMTAEEWHHVTGSAIVRQIEVNVDIEGAKIIEHTITFESHGTLTFSQDESAESVTDATTIVQLSGIGTTVKHKLLGAETFTELPDVRNVKITLTADNKPYASSSTGGYIKRCKGNFDASLSMQVYTADFSEVEAFINTAREIQIIFSDGLMWEFKWMKFGTISDMVVDRENAGVEGGTLNAELSGFETVSDVDTAGYVNDPAENQWWPPA